MNNAAKAIAKVLTDCAYCGNPPPYKCKPCNDDAKQVSCTDVDAEPGIFEPHGGRRSIVGQVAPDFWFV